MQNLNYKDENHMYFICKLHAFVTSCGTSCMRSSALIWSNVSMDGDKPPCRQNIYISQLFLNITAWKFATKSPVPS